MNIRQEAQDLFLNNLRSDDRVLVTGAAGWFGRTAIAMTRGAGLELLATGSKDQKIEIDGQSQAVHAQTLEIILAAGAQLEIEEIQVGEKVYLAGNTAGISDDAWDIIRRNKVFLKAPITTPQGGGYKSLNVTTRKFLGLYSNVRPCMSLQFSWACFA
jgi:hypothetical protein